MDLERRQYYQRVHEYRPSLLSASAAEIDFLDITPKEIKVQVPLVDLFERVKRLPADAWQRHLCNYLQSAAENRHLERTWAIIHAEGQLGKTSIISQVFPAWLIGHDPTFRFVLAMYNQRRSLLHSSVVLQIMGGNVFKDIFHSSAKDLELVREGAKVSSAGWSTSARRDMGDGQLSFNPVGLQSGFTGSGFDWLGIDDPYKESKEAFSTAVRETLANFYEYTVKSRTGLHSCITGMFHRYAPEDFAGFLLDTGDFDYIRYASECDGDYVHTKTGKRYPDPLDRKLGELISPERRPRKYYDSAKKNNRVWLSMYQGRPSSEEGEYFNVGRIPIKPKELAAERASECLAILRAYDNAATDEAGAYTVGAKMGIRPGGRITVFDLFRERLDTGARMAAQEANARADGSEVIITIPRDPGSAGKDTVFHTKQLLKEFMVEEMPTSGISKERRAEPYSYAVNTHLVEFIEGDWNTYAKQELRDFPLSEFKDVVDAMSDGYNKLYQIMTKGKIITGYSPQRNLLTYSQFAKLFPSRNAAGKRVVKVPDAWNIYAAVKTSADASLPNCGIVVARASKNTGIEEALFILGEYKEYDNDYHKLFEWLHTTLTTFSKRTDPENTTIWLHPDSKHFAPAIRQKLDVGIAEFKGDTWAGYPELNWYFIPVGGEPHPIVGGEEAARMYGLVKPGMLEVARDADDNPAREGLYSLRQEIRTCGYDEKGEPAKTCQLLDCLRMIVAGFSTAAADLTEQELYEQFLGPEGIVEPDEEITPERHAQLVEARRRARLRLKKYQFGEDYFDQEDEIFIDSYEQLGVADEREWNGLDPEEQFYRKRDAILKAIGVEEE